MPDHRSSDGGWLPEWAEIPMVICLLILVAAWGLAGVAFTIYYLRN